MVNEIDNFGYCGKNCSSCELYLNHECAGCKTVLSENKKISINCQNCDIKFCAEKKGISFCFVCPKFPCQYFSFFSKEEIAKLYEQKTIICSNEETI